MTDLPLDPDGEPRPGSGPASGPTLGPAVLVFVGGAVGTSVRHLLEQAFPPRPGGWPVATFGINLAGALLLGVLLQALARRGPDVGGLRKARLLAGTGFCGGFTTYSTLALEVDRLGRGGHWPLALAYPVLSLALGVTASAAGVRLAGRRR